MTRARRFAAVAAVVVLAGCSSSADSGASPIVGEIDAAVDAVETAYGGPQEFFEISAGLTEIAVIVAVEGATAAERSTYTPGEGLSTPVDVGEASGATFTADQIAFDEDRIFDQLRDELDSPAIIDFAIQGGPDAAVIYDATIASDGGGILLVLLSGDGVIQGVQGR